MFIQDIRKITKITYHPGSCHVVLLLLVANYSICCMRQVANGMASLSWPELTDLSRTRKEKSRKVKVHG